ncbi:MAG: hypothetical protein IMZ43_10595 [Thermoplasmata archaeon]|nr:hypothetical protein [Thermoplasmata archaeon]
MTKQAFVLGVLLVVFVLVAGCAEQVSKRSYTNTVYGFSLNPPVGWHSVENESSDVAVRFSPFNYSNVSLRITPPFSLSEGRALSTFADEIEENLSESGMNYTIVYREWRAMDGANAYEIVYSYEESGTVQRVKQVAVQITRAVFLITFTAPSNLYLQHITGVDLCIDSFR